MDQVRAFEALYESTYAEVLRFVHRRAPTQAEDIVADAYLVVWRRWPDVPADPDDARAWLFGVARHVLLNADCGAGRRTALEVRLLDARPATTDEAEFAAARVDLARAWHRLSPVHQEALALTLLDCLTAPQAAEVLDISPVAYRLRLSRARRALRAHLSATQNATLERSTCDVS